MTSPRTRILRRANPVSNPGEGTGAGRSIRSRIMPSLAPRTRSRERPPAKTPPHQLEKDGRATERQDELPMPLEIRPPAHQLGEGGGMVGADEPVDLLV